MSAPAIGEMYTVTPFRAHDGTMLGRWHCRITGARPGAGHVCAQQITPADGGGWRNRMSTMVPVGALVPLEVQVDLFGDPAGAP
jgi:hypothetical protein